MEVKDEEKNEIISTKKFFKIKYKICPLKGANKKWEAFKLIRLMSTILLRGGGMFRFFFEIISDAVRCFL